jgi:hypothetical protein
MVDQALPLAGAAQGDEPQLSFLRENKALGCPTRFMCAGADASARLMVYGLKPPYEFELHIVIGLWHIEDLSLEK